jgi:hypothetical protein
MTKEEQAHLSSIAAKLERYAVRAEEGLKHTSSRLDRIENGMDVNNKLLREALQVQQQQTASILATCAERQQRLSQVESDVQALERGERSAPTFAFDPNIITPAVHPMPLPGSPVPPALQELPTNGRSRPRRTGEAIAAGADRYWKWIRERTTTVLALAALLTMLAGAATWMVKTYEKIQKMETAVIQTADDGGSRKP